MPYPELKMLIAGEWTNGSSGNNEQVICPADGSTIGNLPHASPTDLDRALQSSLVGFNIWRKMTPHDRQVILEKDLYLASLQTILDHINTIPSTAKSAVMFGHNPGISEISTYLSSEYVEMPTCCIVSLEFNLEGWGMVSGRTGNLVKLDYPKNTLL